MESGQNMHKSKAKVLLRNEELLVGAGNKTSPTRGDHSLLHIGSTILPT